MSKEDVNFALKTLKDIIVNYVCLKDQSSLRNDLRIINTCLCEIPENTPSLYSSFATIPALVSVESGGSISSSVAGGFSPTL